MPEATASVDPKTQKTTLFMTPPNPATAGFNALTFDKKGNVYVSDSFQGIIWQTGPGGSTPTKWYSPTNHLALFLPFAVVPEIAVDSAWTLQVKHFNIPKIELEDSD